MRAIGWLLRLTVFVLLLGFAVKNDARVDLYFFLGTHWNLPLSLIILLAFAAGAVLGLIAALMPVLRLRREVSRLRQAPLPAAQAAMPVQDAPPAV
ncbi:MAG: LapA family protein [Rhodocyclaceae bacterium]|nr:LapA family protein [Rhodocyclaceae bacterium]MBX3670257.1 LapA family protein [Rhodocyclaceae bacterium]